MTVDVVGSDGGEYRELAKPMDDLRQDAVMQHKQSSQIRKRIRSYKVALLTPTVGFVQWVKDTLPIGVYLSVHLDESFG